MASRESLSRTPLNRAVPDAGSRYSPRKSGLNDASGSRAFGDRSRSGLSTGDRYTRNGRYGNNVDPDYGVPGYGRPGYGHGGYGRYGRYHNHHHYPHYYHHYGHYPYYGYGYGGHGYGYGYGGYGFGIGFGFPYFGFGLSFWDTPDYYDAYYTQPTVVYAQPAIVESQTYYTEPAPYYADSGTTYVQSQTYAAPVESGTTYVERRVEPQYTAPSTSTVTTAPAPQQTAVQSDPSAKQPDQRVLAAVGRGNEHFGAGRYSDARKSYGEAMGFDDSDGIAMLLFGLASFAEGDFGTAGTVTMRALDATPDLIYYPFNIKALYRNQERFQEHVNVLVRHVDTHPGDDQARFLLGYMWYGSGDAQSAKGAFQYLAINQPSEKLYPELRDASTKAIEMMAKQPQSAPNTSTP